MASVFADTSFFIARIHPGDDLHNIAISAFRDLDPVETILKTSNAVLIEFLEYFSDFGSYRSASAAVVENVIRQRDIAGTRIDVIDLDRRLFLDAFVFFSGRGDVSFTESLSITMCKKSRIDAVLTHNPHFAEQGLRILM